VEKNLQQTNNQVQVLLMTLDTSWTHTLRKFTTANTKLPDYQRSCHKATKGLVSCLDLKV